MAAWRRIASVAFIVFILLLFAGGPIAMGAAAVFLSGGDWTFGPAVSKVLMGLFFAALAGFGIRAVLPVMFKSVQQLRERVVFELDAEGLRIGGELYALRELGEVILESSTDDAVWSVAVRRADGTPIALSSGISHQSEARWLADVIRSALARTPELASGSADLSFAMSAVEHDEAPHAEDSSRAAQHARF
ncbi:MAG: hypothetical protein U0414_17090 [Polyangiaceae bacterium]